MVLVRFAGVLQKKQLLNLLSARVRPHYASGYMSAYMHRLCHRCLAVSGHRANSANPRRSLWLSWPYGRNGHATPANDGAVWRRYRRPAADAAPYALQQMQPPNAMQQQMFGSQRPHGQFSQSQAQPMAQFGVPEEWACHPSK
jgi:hypothetical protein